MDISNYLFILWIDRSKKSCVPACKQSETKKNQMLKYFSMGLHKIGQTTHVAYILEFLSDISSLRINEKSIGTTTVIWPISPFSEKLHLGCLHFFEEFWKFIPTLSLDHIQWYSIRYASICEFNFCSRAAWQWRLWNSIIFLKLNFCVVL